MVLLMGDPWLDAIVRRAAAGVRVCPGCVSRARRQSSPDFHASDERARVLSRVQSAHRLQLQLVDRQTLAPSSGSESGRRGSRPRSSAARLLCRAGPNRDRAEARDHPPSGVRVSGYARVRRCRLARCQRGVSMAWRGALSRRRVDPDRCSRHRVRHARYLAALPLWQGALFIAVHQALFGLYMGAVFAPNHKGMPLIANGCTLDPLQRQVLTSRNVRSHPITDFMFGGLNYQIEHHLFPQIPRNRLKDTQRVVRAFCRAHGIPYREVGLLASYRETFCHLSRVSASLCKSPGSVPADLPSDRFTDRPTSTFRH